MFRSRGLAYGHLKKYALALADFNCAIALDPQVSSIPCPGVPCR